MRDVAAMNHLVFDKDVKLLSTGKLSSFYNYLQNNANMTWFAVVWCTTEWEVTENVKIPCHYSKSNGKNMIMYNIFFNFSLADNAFLKPP